MAHDYAGTKRFWDSLRSALLCGDLADAHEYSAEERRGELGRKDADDQPVVVRTRELSKRARLHCISIDLAGDPLDTHGHSTRPQ